MQTVMLRSNYEFDFLFNTETDLLKTMRKYLIKDNNLLKKLDLIIQKLIHLNMSNYIF
jgi:hypothetical protein